MKPNIASLGTKELIESWIVGAAIVGALALVLQIAQ